MGQRVCCYVGRPRISFAEMFTVGILAYPPWISVPPDRRCAAAHLWSWWSSPYHVLFIVVEGLLAVSAFRAFHGQGRTFKPPSL